MFQLTCRQGYFSKREVISKEKCKLLHHNKYYLKLGPFNLEILRDAPYLSIFHNLITDKEIEWLIGESRPKLSASRTALQYQSNQQKGVVKVIENGSEQSKKQDIDLSGVKLPA